MKRSLLLSIIILACLNFFGQNPAYFKSEVEIICLQEIPEAEKSDLIVFTGSSSIRYWENLKGSFPNRNVTNNGFGGSHMSDLLYYAGKVIVEFNPVQVFIYEGDNDLDYGKTIDSIIRDTKNLVSYLQDKLPNCSIMIISAKPSPARWHLKEQFIKLNSEFNKLASQQYNVEFVSIWNIMLDEDGKPISEIYKSDGLHMNEKGYELWTKIITPYMLK